VFADNLSIGGIWQVRERNSTWVILLVILLVVLFAWPLMLMGGWLMGPSMMGPGMMGPGMMGSRGYGYGFGWLGALFQMLFFLVFLGLIVFGIYYLVGGGRSARSRSIEALKERYAKGEITKEEYERIKQELSKED